MELAILWLKLEGLVVTLGAEALARLLLVLGISFTVACLLMFTISAAVFDREDAPLSLIERCLVRS